MAGKKKTNRPKSRGKGRQKSPMSKIGSALFPRAMFAAVPRSPEPPPEPPEERSPSALSSALLNASLLGRVIATPPGDGTLLSTASEGMPTWTKPPQEGTAASMDNSMARSSMYDYEDSEEDAEEQDEYEEPGYATVPLSHRQQRGTISNRAKLATPVQSDSLPSSDDDGDDITPISSDEDFTEEPRLAEERVKAQEPSDTPSPAPRLYHTLEKEEEELVGATKSSSRSKGKGRTPADRPEDLYAKAAKPDKRSMQHKSNELSESSSLTMVTSPHEDDFSDLITPPPPWKQKGKAKNKKKAGRQSPSNHGNKLTKEQAQREKVHRTPRENVADIVIHEPIIERVEATTASTMQQSSPPIPAPRSTSQQSQSPNEPDTYSHIQHHPSHLNKEEEYLRKTNSRLEKELGIVQREREQLLETLQQQAQTQSLLQGSLKSLSPPPHQPRRVDGEEVESESHQLRSGLQRMTSINDEMQQRLEEMHRQCDKLRLENQAIKEVNDHLHAENSKLKTISESIKDGDYAQQALMRKQAEEVIAENEQLKTIIHKLNIQLSRYQAKQPPPQKGDPPGLPSRGRTPRWLTDTKYLSPLITAYEDALKEKDQMVQVTLDDLSRLRKSAEDVIHENQRLHLRLEQQAGRTAGVSPVEWHRVQEHARLVLEENQVVIGQLDILQSKQKDIQRAHSLEVAKMGKRLAIVESEKSDLEAQVSEVKHRYSALKQQHDRSLVDAQHKMPIQEHMSTLADYKRTLEEEQRQHQAEIETLLSKLSSVQGEKKTLSLRMADNEAEVSQMQGEMKAMHRVQKKLQHKIALLQKELEHNENKLVVSNQHLNKVLAIAEQTAAERDALTQVAKSRELEKKKAVNRLMEGNVTIGRLEEKLKSYRMKADLKLGNLSSRMEAQDSTHISKLREYEREMAHLKSIVQEKQESMDSLVTEKRKVEEQLETVWQTATADNRRMKAKLHRSLNSTDRQNAFEYESDNKGLISSESD